MSLVIPCYNEVNTIENCIERCRKLASDNLELELVIVDDCSTDNSIAVAEKLSQQYPEVQLIKHAYNQGKGAALRTGFRHATGDFVGIQDADAEYDPRDYLKMLKPLREGRADVVYGSRYLRPSSRRVLYFWHTWMNRSLTFVSNMFSNLDISDMETCYKLFRRDIIQTIAPQLREDRFGFEPEVTAHVAQMGCRVHECAIHYEPRSYEEGKKIGWKDGVRALYCILHYSAHTAPLPMQILLYFFIGLVCALLNISSFAVFSSVGLGLGLSVAAAFLVAAACNYLLCTAILFRHKARWSATGEIFAYILTIAIMGALDYAITLGLAGLGVSALWSKSWASFVGFIGNFVFRKYLVF